MTTPAPVTREEHFARINDHNKNAEIGRQWEITEDEYYYFLCALPPMRYKIPGTRESFAMSEFLTGSITSAYFQTEDGRYFHRTVNYRQPAKPFEE